MQNKKATRTITGTIGVILAVAAFNHGLFEVLQGNKGTDGILIQAIGPEHRFWIHGTEEAFTLIPNFLYSGIVTMIISIFAIIWSVVFIHRKNGPSIFVLTFLVLTFTGGGIGHIIFYTLTWAYARQINKSLSWWDRKLSFRVKGILSKIWPYTLAIIAVLFLLALEIAVFGYFPGIRDPDTALYICFTFLLTAWVLINLTYISGFSYDLIRDKNSSGR